MTKKEIILKTSLELFAQNGIQETPMSLISKESGVAVGTIYHHFTSKTDIINYLFIELKKEFSNALTKNMGEYIGNKNISINQGKKDAKIIFTVMWKNLYEFYSNNEDKFRFLIHIGPLPIITRENFKKAISHHDPIVQFMELAMELKIIKPYNIRLITEILHSNIATLVQLSLQKTVKVTPQILNDAIDMSWNAVAYDKTK